MESEEKKSRYLIAREAKDDKALIFVLFMKGLEAFVLGCEPTKPRGLIHCYRGKEVVDALAKRTTGMQRLQLKRPFLSTAKRHRISLCQAILP
jgi:hypothetical protein